MSRLLEGLKNPERLGKVTAVARAAGETLSAIGDLIEGRTPRLATVARGAGRIAVGLEIAASAVNEIMNLGGPAEEVPGAALINECDQEVVASRTPAN